MAQTKEIRKKIGSVQNTKKITSAMELVASSKMKKTQDAMRKGKPYSKKIVELINNLAGASSEYKHPFFKTTEQKTDIYIVVSTDKGLCGGLNSNLFKLALNNMAEREKQGRKVKALLFGRKATDVFSRLKNAEVLGSATKLGDIPTAEDVIGSAQIAISDFEEGNIGNVYLYANEFINTMSQRPFEKKLLPISSIETEEEQAIWDYIYEPGSKEILDKLLKRYIETQIYQAVIENNACEQAAKMIAMKNASENAEEIIKELQLLYNNARQASITQELSEIVGGAAAI
jgi:F-type H+-transporting ATPase subunit gamma|tara:strand:+ start:771 stop:1634 length:864 start_codon:yes stop_codon:yes gene_type:complete